MTSTGARSAPETLATPDMTVGPDAGPTVGSAVRCTQLVKRFGRTRAALAGVDLHCAAGNFVVLVGPSGCGKTTLLRTVAGLETPTSGRVFIDDLDVTEQPAQQRGTAMVFQNYGLYPDKTVGENIEFPLRMAKVRQAERQRRVDAVARLLHIHHLLGRRPAELSGGEKQRTGIGRAIVRTPRVLLMDEPLSNLDATLRTEMRAEIKHLQTALGTTVLYVTHDQVEALTLANTLIVTRDGRIEQIGAAADVYRRPATQFVAGFLGGMNLFDATADGPILDVANGGALVAPDGPRPAPGSPVVVRFRPDDVSIAEHDPSAQESPGLVGDVVLVEMTGPSQVIHVATAGVRVRVTADAATPAPEGAVRLTIPPTALHLYPATDGHGKR